MPATFLPQSAITLAAPGECHVATDSDCRLICRDVRSSVVLAVSALSIRLAGLLRFAYPDSAAKPELARECPCLFADTGIPVLLSRVRAYGLTDRDLKFYALGAAALREHAQKAAWGKANELALKKILWRERLYLHGEDLGGEFARSLWLEPGSGRFIVRTQAYRAAAPAHDLRYAV